VAGTTCEIRLSELELSKITSSPEKKIPETKYSPSWMLESLNTKLLDGGFWDSEAGLVSVIEVKIFCPPKGCLVLDILRDQSVRNCQRPCLFCSFLFNLSISFPSFCYTAIRDRTEFIFCVFCPTTSRPAITDSIFYR
jgi:hypothetical protein